VDGAVVTVTSDAARAGRRAAPRRGAPRGGSTRDARDVDGVAAMRDVRAFMSSRGWLWRRVAKPAENDRKTSTTTRRSKGSWLTCDDVARDEETARRRAFLSSRRMTNGAVLALLLDTIFRATLFVSDTARRGLSSTLFSRRDDDEL
jgi:hypothetical protein